jgi:hypothetical protein
MVQAGPSASLRVNKPRHYKEASCVNRGLRKRRWNGRGQNRVTTLELGENGGPGGLEGALKMNGLNADQRQGSTARKNAGGARAGRVVNVFLEGAAQPILFVGIDFGWSDEIAVEHVLGFSSQYIR